ncbi:hypothetical protein TNCV_2491711 [Trichonephila clavipes]|nr:hypothetical protein TNCV_2491711 [Trichonephila clavipes]
MAAEDDPRVSLQGDVELLITMPPDGQTVDSAENNEVSPVVAYCSSTSTVSVLFPSLARATQPYIPNAVDRLKTTKLACGLKHRGVSLQTDHLLGTSAHAPQRLMGTVGPGPHGLLRH